MAQTMTLAKALLRRKQGHSRLATLNRVATQAQFESKVQRQPAHEGIDSVIVVNPRLDKDEVTKAVNKAAHQQRLLDTAIQNANWTTEITVSAILNQRWENGMTRKDGNVTMKLAEALAKRKSLNEEVRSVGVDIHSLVETHQARKKATEGIDDLLKKTEKIDVSKATENFDFVWDQLTAVDEVIHKINNETEITVEDAE